MPTDNRGAIVEVLNEVIGSLDKTLSHPSISHSKIDIGQVYQVYLNASRMKVAYILTDPESDIEALFTDPLLVTCRVQSQNISRLAGQANWRRVLEESHKLLIQLPGEPVSEPGELPPPPDEFSALPGEPPSQPGTPQSPPDTD